MGQAQAGHVLAVMGGALGVIAAVCCCAFCVCRRRHRRAARGAVHRIRVVIPPQTSDDNLERSGQGAEDGSGQGAEDGGG
jgi:hypothetical protein